MDYEKKYKEALKLARANHKFYKEHTDCDKHFHQDVKLLESIFPELRESEDERIRKWIANYIHIGEYSEDEHPMALKAIHWLEKQEIFSNGEGLYYYRPDGNCTFMGTGLGPIERVTINGEPPKTENNSVDLPDSVKINQIGVMAESEEKQKPMYNLEIPAGDVAPAEEDGPFDEDEFLENELLAFLQNYDKEYDDDAAVSDVARHFYEIGKKQKERVPENAEMGTQEQKPVEPSDDELQRHQDELYDFKVFATKQAKEHHISFVHDFEWNNFCAELLSYFNEQKPADYNEYKMLMDGAREDGKIKGRKEVIDHPEKYGLQKSIEWSEEDEKNLELVIDCIYEYYPEPVKKYKLKDWLKFLRPQPKQEWSEDDERRRDGIIQWLREYQKEFNPKYDSLSIESIESLIDWLKSLRPQPKKELSIEKAIQWLNDTFYFWDNSSGRGRDCEIKTYDFDSLEEMYDSFRKAVTVDSQPTWKPSEEQMKYLLMLADYFESEGGTSNAKTLRELYENLKKL